MERTIDRTSYRRSTRMINVSEEYKEPKVKMVNRKFKMINLLLNQIIVSLLIIIGVLTANYFDMKEITNWISDNLSGGYSALQIASKIKNKFVDNNFSTIVISGEAFEYISGDFLNDYSGEKFLEVEKTYSGELLSAVEGINQMSDDAKKIKEQYNFYTPINGVITSRFGSRESDNPIISTYHTGLDIGAKEGTEIYSAHSGKVIMAQNYSTYGNCVMIEDGDLITVYAHCSSLLVKEGQIINKGDVIARVGMTGNATGPHLHFEVRYNGRFVDPEKVL